MNRKDRIQCLWEDEVLVTNKVLLDKAKAGSYAVGAFNINNLEFVQAITSAAGELGLQSNDFA